MGIKHAVLFTFSVKSITVLYKQFISDNRNKLNNLKEKKMFSKEYSDSSFHTDRDKLFLFQLNAKLWIEQDLVITL